VSSREARATLKTRFENRDSDFLTLMRRAVYENPESPYLALLKNAGCRYGDLRGEVARQGLEAALRKLFQEGVFLTVNEFKGRLPGTWSSKQAYPFCAIPGPGVIFWPTLAGAPARTCRS
jgi:hypothetical protein